jgi:glycosyltransferase involved in cell wall biosynthesis
MKKRLAIWTFGGIGTGHFSQGLPVLEQLVNRISTSFEIVVYSRSNPEREYCNPNVVLRTAPEKIRNSTLRWSFLIYYFLFDCFRARFDILLGLWGWPSGCIVTILGKLLGIQSVVYVLGADAAGIASINYGILHRPVLGRFARWTYNRTNLLLVISNYQKDRLQAFGIQRAIAVVPWGVDASTYTFKNKRALTGVVRFIHVGHLSLVKDQVTLLKAFAIISARRPSELQIFGADCLNGAVQKLCFELGIDKKVTFRDMVRHEDMPTHYQSAHVMLHTSLSEGQSMALTEGAASGVLLAGTAVGLLYDLKGEGGITVDAGQYEELAEKVLITLNDPLACDRYLRNAKDWSECHSFDWTVKTLTRHFNNLPPIY